MRENNMSATQIVCPHCHAINRVPSARLNDAPQCGKCHASLLPGKPVELSQSDFTRFIEKSELPVVVDFWADWCGPCKSMAPAFSEAARTLTGKVVLAKVNTERAPALSQQFGIRSIPCLIKFSGGREIARQAGAMGQNDIVRWCQH